jgi:dolichyl-phosphate-mannose-protein mannosyltransferase
VTHFHNSPNAIPTTPAQAPPAPEQVNPPEQANQQAVEDQSEQEPNVTPEAKYPHLHGSKARVEFRDQHGNVLDEDLVASLQNEGKVSFETRYETRTRLSKGHEVDIVDGQVPPPVPPHPDVEGQNPETVGEQEKQHADDIPASVAGGERSAEKADIPEAKPASEGNEAT